MMFDGKRQRVAMFKPQDEEAFAPNNPRGYEGHLGQKGFRSGVKVLSAFHEQMLWDLRCNKFFFSGDLG